MQHFFQNKWAVDATAKIESLRKMCSQDRCTLCFEQDEVFVAAGKLNKRNRLHNSGLCTEILRLLAVGNQSFIHALNATAKRTDTWTCENVSGFLKGKESSCPPPKGMRAIIPLDPMQQMWDSLLAQRLQSFLDSILLPSRGVHIGAREAHKL